MTTIKEMKTITIHSSGYIDILYQKKLEDENGTIYEIGNHRESIHLEDIENHENEIVKELFYLKNQYPKKVKDK